jgi:hypothetical protein
MLDKEVHSIFPSQANYAENHEKTPRSAGRCQDGCCPCSNSCCGEEREQRGVGARRISADTAGVSFKPLWERSKTGYRNDRQASTRYFPVRSWSKPFVGGAARAHHAARRASADSDRCGPAAHRRSIIPQDGARCSLAWLGRRALIGSNFRISHGGQAGPPAFSYLMVMPRVFAGRGRERTRRSIAAMKPPLKTL